MPYPVPIMTLTTLFPDWHVLQCLWKQGEVALHWPDSWGEGVLQSWQVYSLPVGWSDFRMQKIGEIWTWNMNTGIQFLILSQV